MSADVFRFSAFDIPPQGLLPLLPDRTFSDAPDEQRVFSTPTPMALGFSPARGCFRLFPGTAACQVQLWPRRRQVVQFRLGSAPIISRRHSLHTPTRPRAS